MEREGLLGDRRLDRCGENGSTADKVVHYKRGGWVRVKVGRQRGFSGRKSKSGE